MPNYKLNQAAAEDIEHLFEYGIDNFGVTAARSYVDGLTHRFKIDATDPAEAIKFRMDQQGLSNADLVPLLGQRSRVSKILNKKRKLSISMIRNLHQQLKIPLENLISDYCLVK